MIFRNRYYLFCKENFHYEPEWHTPTTYIDLQQT